MTAGVSGLIGATAMPRRPIETQDLARRICAARIKVTAVGGNGGVEFTQSHRALVDGKSYDLSFWQRRPSTGNSLRRLEGLARVGQLWTAPKCGTDDALASGDFDIRSQSNGTGRTNPVPLRRANRLVLDR